MRFLVAIPVFNEERYINRVLPRVMQYAQDVLIVDDGSTDRTAEMVQGFRASQPRVRVLRHERNAGYGQSLISAFDYAQHHNYDWVITLDCDEQHDPVLIQDFVRRMRADESDIISGSRYLDESLTHDMPPADRRRINMTCNAMIEQVLGLKLTDSFCGFKAYRVAALRRLRLTERGYAFPLQFWVQCVRNGLRIEELAVTRVYRDANRSFGQVLDNPGARLRHYLEVFVRSLRESGVTETARRPRLASTVCEHASFDDHASSDECRACRLPA